MRSAAGFIRTKTEQLGQSDTYRLLEVGDEVVAVLVLLQTSERHLGARDVLNNGGRGISLAAQGADITIMRTFLGFSRYSKRVFSSHVTPLLTLAAVYE